MQCACEAWGMLKMDFLNSFLETLKAIYRYLYVDIPCTTFAENFTHMENSYEFNSLPLEDRVAIVRECTRGNITDAEGINKVREAYVRNKYLRSEQPIEPAEQQQTAAPVSSTATPQAEGK